MTKGKRAFRLLLFQSRPVRSHAVHKQLQSPVESQIRAGGVVPGHALCPGRLLALVSPASPCVSSLHCVSYCGAESLGNMKQALILQDSDLLQMYGDTKSSFQSTISL